MSAGQARFAIAVVSGDASIADGTAPDGWTLLAEGSSEGLAASADQNLAVGTVTAGSAGAGAQNPGNPTNANDGNAGTYCQFHGGGADGSLPERWITSDLGAAYSVDRFTTLTTGNGADDLYNRLQVAATPSPPNQYTRFRYSTDNGVADPWHDIAVTRISNDGNTPQLETYTFDGGAIVARYWQIYMAGKNNSNIWTGGNVYTWDIRGSAVLSAGGKIVGKYIAHDSSVTSPFAG